MDRSILSKVQQAEVDLLDVLTRDDSDIERFADSWHSLSIDVQNAVESGLLDESTMWTIHVITNNIAVISQDFLDLRAHADTQTSNLMSELEQLFSEVTLDESPPKALHSPPTKATSDSSTRSIPASYIGMSYCWLLQNLHDPYPSKKIKESIASRAGRSVKEIDNWFVEARRRIGWNALRRSRFSNKRQSIIEAASSFFGKSNNASQLCPDLELEFANIQSQAENLYPHKGSERALILDSNGNDRERQESGRPRKRRYTSSEPDSVTAPSGSCQNRHTGLLGCALQEGNARLADDTLSSDTDSRASSIGPSQSPCSSPTSSASCLTPVSTLPISLETYHVSTAAPLKRKRRLSLNDGAEMPKRPRMGCAGPRRQVVSDPLPHASISSPSQNNSFGTDLSKFLEVEFFDPSVLFGSPESLCEVPQSTTQQGEANKTTLALTADVLQSQARGTLLVGDHLRHHALASVADASKSDVHSPPTTDLPYLDITLDGLTDQIFSGTTFDWLTPFLDDTSFNGFLEPSSLFQMELPPINDIFSLDCAIPSAVY